eukprot:5200823-Lingulodinium_polyedra.AAC.1
MMTRELDLGCINDTHEEQNPLSQTMPCNHRRPHAHHKPNKHHPHRDHDPQEYGPHKSHESVNRLGPRQMPLAHSVKGRSSSSKSVELGLASAAS